MGTPILTQARAHPLTHTQVENNQLAITFSARVKLACVIALNREAGDKCASSQTQEMGERHTWMLAEELGWLSGQLPMDEGVRGPMGSQVVAARERVMKVFEGAVAAATGGDACGVECVE